MEVKYIFELILENKNGDKISLTSNNKYVLTEIDGLNSPNASINTSDGIFDGERYNSSKMEMRTILLSIDINSPADENRINLYKVARPKEYIKINYKNRLREVFLEGYVNSTSIGYMEMKQNATISIICPEPYFKGAQEIINEIALVIKMFNFPFTSEEEPVLCFGIIQEILETEIINIGETDTGLIITLEANGDVLDPIIFNRGTGEFIGVNFMMRTGDEIIINTNVGEKSVTLFRNGEKTNIFNNLMKDITWLQLRTGNNVFAFETKNGETPEHLTLKFKYSNKYGGV